MIYYEVNRVWGMFSLPEWVFRQFWQSRDWKFFEFANDAVIVSKAADDFRNSDLGNMLQNFLRL